MFANPVADAIIIIAAVLTAVAVIAGTLIRVYKIANRIDGALGVDPQGRTVAERLRAVEYQVYQNSGSSLFDRVVQMEQRMATVHGEIDVVKGLLTELVDRK